MNSSIKDQIAADLNKAKNSGGQRLERIGKIIQDALSQAVSELKQGGSELQAIAKESTLVETLKAKSAPATASTAATAPTPVEVRIDSDDQPVSDAVIRVVEVNPVETVENIDAPDVVITTITDEQIAESILEVQSAEPEAKTVDETDNETAQTTQPEPVVQNLTDSVNAMYDRIAAFAKDEKTQAAVQPYWDKLKTAFGLLDQKAAAQYGDRYSSFKQEFQQDMSKAKVWYTETRANVNENGATWVEQKQAELEAKMSEAGAKIAQKETKIKQVTQALWQTVSKS